jgi:ubiquinone/menaquinone biosynthesis C-methylase UbiE
MKSDAPAHDNPFESAIVAQEWIASVENERGGQRDHFIYRYLGMWASSLLGGSVADIGCGQGICSEHISRRLQYIGVEPSEPLLARARARYGSERVDFVQGAASDIPLKDESVDGVLSVNVWLSLPSLPGAAREMARVTKPGGRLLVITANPDAWDRWKAMFNEPQQTGKMLTGGSSTPGTALSRDVIYNHQRLEIFQALLDAGWQIDKLADIGMPKPGSKRMFTAIEAFKPAHL